MKLKISEAQLILFVLVDSSGVVVPGLDDSFSVLITKNGGPFASGVGTKAEISSGWYSYELTAGETDTAGPLGLLVTGVGAVAQNLIYEVSGTVFDEPAAGSNILTAAEGAAVLRCEEDDPDMLALLPLVDAYIRNATGHDWTADVVIFPEAKSPARMLLKIWHEDPGMQASGTALSFGLSAALTQLEYVALRFKTFHGRNGPGTCRVAGLYRGDHVQSLTGLVGATGDQASKFESAVYEHNEIQQLDSEDLSHCWYRIEILSPGEMP